jgi:RNA polymerase sigma factor (sigma-70 family)
MNDVIGHLRRVALRGDGGLTDSQLLERFLARRDQAAFAALVRRHGPMVLAVCRRVLGNHHDAEDAFQATFLVLARKAAALRARDLVGNWLHGVAYRTALGAKAMTARRQAHERQARELAQPRAPADDGWQELLPLLDQELDRLPERYRVAVVLCDLEGMTRRDAARQLGVPKGTLSGRLTRARLLLARRLARYGLAPSAGALAVVLAGRATTACVPSTLAASTAKAAVLASGGDVLAAGAVPARVVTLTEGVMKTMLLSKLKGFVAVAFVLFLSAGAVGLTYRTGAAQPAPATPADGGRVTADDLDALRLEVEALRKGLQATRGRVKALEEELQALKSARRAEGVGVNVQEQRAGSLLYGVGVNSDAGLTGGIILNERNLDSGRAVRGAGQEVRIETAPGTQVQRYSATWREPLANAEAALQKLRKDPSDKQAVDALERALKRLKERAKPDWAAGNPQKK